MNKVLKTMRLKKFFDIIFQQYKNTDYCEIRIMGCEKELYNVLVSYFKKHKIYYKNAVQCFFKKNEIDKLVKFIELLNKNSKAKICYTPNPRQMHGGIIATSGYSNMSRVNFLYFDIEKTAHTQLTELDEKYLLNYVDVLIKIFEKYKLLSPTIIHSGNGIHLLYGIKTQSITEGKKLWYKEWFDNIMSKYSRDSYKIDDCKDFSRILGLPTTINPKHSKEVRVLKYSKVINDFNLKSLRLKKSTKDINYKHKINDLTQSLEWQILLKHPPSTAGFQRHTYICWPIKMLIRDLNIKDYKYYQTIATNILGRPENFNPANMSKDVKYNIFIIYKWCKNHDEWCRKNGINYKEYIDKALE